MTLLALFIGVVLGVLATLLAIQHRREHQQALSLQHYHDVAKLYLRTLSRHSVTHLQRYQSTYHPTSGQKRLLEELHYAGELMGMVNGRFVVDLENTVLDRNGCVELWVSTQDSVSEVFYLPTHAIGAITGVFSDINQLLKQHLTTKA